MSLRRRRLKVTTIKSRPVTDYSKQ